MSVRFPHLATLNPRSRGPSASQGWTVLVTEPSGFIDGKGGHGLFVQETRLLSRYRYRINGDLPFTVAISNVEQHSWLGYYVAPSPAKESGETTDKAPTEKVIELRLARAVGEGFHEDVDLTNYTGEPIDVPLEIDVDADFADLQETHGERQQKGKQTRRWAETAPDVWELVLDYHAEHAYEHQGENGTAQIHRALTIRIERASSAPDFRNGVLSFRVQLQPRQSWHACLSFLASIYGRALPLLYSCRMFGNTGNECDRKRAEFLHRSTTFHFPGSDTLTAIVAGTLEQSRRDLAALRLYPLDQAEDAWTVAAGLPKYVALFGRDPLITAWQAAPLTADILRGTLAVLPQSQGTTTNDWRDEQPGRLIHQMQRSPLAVLNYNPFARYYGSMSSPIFYSEILFALYLWSGDKEEVSRYVRPALRAMQWLDRYGDLDGDGFYEYQTHSEKGVKNQGWKDSGDAFVYEDGSQVEPPIATAEVQACAYIAKRHLAQVLDWLGYRDEPDILRRQAHELKQRFNDTFWMPDEEYLPMGLDPKKQLIRSISSDAGACLAADIIDRSRVRQLADRLMSDELYSGWGVRTLSTRHPAYNPFSYHRGTVWPVENGILALAFLRYGLHGHLHRLCRGMFELAALFDLYRLPEVIGGQPRDAEHPFPGLYPDACWPQAWSASAVFSLVQAMLGIFPFAPLHVLVVDPCLPDWLPEITLENLRVGEGSCTIRFYRKPDGRSSYQVLAAHGPIHVVRQPSPWSLTAGLGERVEDALVSLLPG